MSSDSGAGTDPDEFHRQVWRLRQQLSDKEPEEFRQAYVAQPGSRPLFSGTTVPAVGVRFVRLPSGLEVPEGAAQRPMPSDQWGMYLTATDVLGHDPGLNWVVATLDKLSAETVLAYTSVLLSQLSGPSAMWPQVDRDYAERAFVGDARARAVNLLQAGRRLLFPQGLLVLAKLAIVRCPDLSTDDNAGVFLPAVLLTLAEHLGADRDADPAARQASLERELISNQHFNSPRDPAHMLARFTRRWLQIPAERAGQSKILDLEGLYLGATGVALRDVVAVALTLWSLALAGTVRVAPTHHGFFGLDPDVVARVCRLLSADRETIRSAVLDEHQRLGGGDTLDWAFSPLEQYPLLAFVDGSYMILSPRLLLDRVFGWLPFFDVRESLRSAGRKKEASQFETCFREVAELYGREVLDALVPSGAIARRVYHEDMLKATYGKTGIKTADAAIDYGTSWVVVEISTRQLTRGPVAGASDVDTDVDALVDKAEQVHSTIAQLRADEARLTGHPSVAGRQFYPVVVVTEGFPINMMVTRKLREAVAVKGFLQEHDTAPLEILDLADLEIVEAVQEVGGPSLQALLEGKRSAGLAEDSFRNYLLIERQLQPGRSRRVDSLWMTPFKLTTEATGQPLPDLRGQ